MFGTAERGVTFTVRYKNSGGTEICKDDNAATLVMINLANAAYRPNDILGGGWVWVSEQGHAAVLVRLNGSCTRPSLTNWANYMVIVMQSRGPTIARLSSFTSREPDYWGTVVNPNVTYVGRLRILAVAQGILDHANQIGYPLLSGKLVKPTDWDRTLTGLTGLRCDGLVEVCYEMSDVDAWGEIVSGAAHYDITVSDAFFQEHNETSWYVSDWPRYIFPATQCGRAGVWRGTTYRGVYWDTQMQTQQVIQPPLP